MAPKRKFDSQLAALDSLRSVSPSSAGPELAQALQLSNSFLAAKAAAIIRHHGLTSLSPTVASVLARFLTNPEQSDRQCLAKVDLAKTLAAFEYQDAELFLTGMRHFQLEKGREQETDCAGALRAICALALVQSRELTSHRVVPHLTPLFADKKLSVRVDVARAVEQVGTGSAALLLRLRAELGSDEPEFLGTCYSGVLALEGSSAIPWIAKFMMLEDDIAAEAAMAIAEAHTAEAFLLLRTTFTRAREPWFRSVVLSAIALTRQQGATNWLTGLVATDNRHSADAVDALCRSAPSAGTVDRLKQLGKQCTPDRVSL